MEHKKIFIFALYACCLFAFSGSVIATDADKAPQEDAEWSEDMDAKIDKAIEVLGVVKKELKEYQKTEKQLKGKEPEETLPKKISALVRLWRKLREVMGAGPGMTPEEEAEMTKDLGAKIDKTIKVMSAIKEELEKSEDTRPKTQDPGQ